MNGDLMCNKDDKSYIPCPHEEMTNNQANKRRWCSGLEREENLLLSEDGIINYYYLLKTVNLLAFDKRQYLWAKNTERVTFILKI